MQEEKELGSIGTVDFSTASRRGQDARGDRTFFTIILLYEIYMFVLTPSRSERFLAAGKKAGCARGARWGPTGAGHDCSGVRRLSMYGNYMQLILYGGAESTMLCGQSGFIYIYIYIYHVYIYIYMHIPNISKYYIF